MKHALQVVVNGRSHALSVESEQTLLEVLRDELALFGAREGCGMSVCGACTVLVDDEPVSSCTFFAVRAHGRRITTVEGLDQDGTLHPVQQAFLEHGAFQCSYCTPGFLLSTICLLRENPHPTESEIRDYLVGNLCRCTAYPEIISAVKALAAEPDRGGQR